MDKLCEWGALLQGNDKKIEKIMTLCEWDVEKKFLSKTLLLSRNFFFHPLLYYFDALCDKVEVDCYTEP